MPATWRDRAACLTILQSRAAVITAFSCRTEATCRLQLEEHITSTDSSVPRSEHRKRCIGRCESGKDNKSNKKEEAFRLLLLRQTNYMVKYNSTVAVYFTSGRYHFRVTVFGAVLKSSTVFPFASRSDLSVLAGKSALSVMEEGASIK